ncbi:uncharacterized protein PODANS_4_6920 [Podospora anserina S mat+]|uniref:Podospora anserina S mat+ genomic DNA chromosome 4, supercontig 4 n=1 Tax=Podospora anserina (strain S / ATCC MYA-4624 / DSM 980 / FGSC 10383) TaxID=515849 RepID=B2ARN5_PODAN|nr:uncharacterized protein PODANS_4_6920 [Podospora anserina S mat+]CAP66813.1 unnamed protein product [Podospora anserina S mat+]CDP28555.1 Putative transporter [Podospora anserina S mat+]
MAGGELTGNSTGAPPQAGVLEGVNPIVYTPSNPITLFIVQAIIVIIFCQLLAYPLRWLHQPRVIAEVLGGILLGPTVMMRIPGFEAAIFPPASMPVFNNVANLGLIIFLFLVALEVDIRLFTQNWKAALSVGMAGMILPFGLGFAIAWGLYKEFHVDEAIGFGVFGLFIGTALAITAFPVLCRILSELNLLRSGVGVTVLAAGIGNDVTGWVLLALCVALTNNSSGLAALWALLCCIGWTLFLIFAIRPPFIWILKRTGSLHNGPTQGMVALTLLMVLASSWFTGGLVSYPKDPIHTLTGPGIIGVHPIFGAFLVGLICPHDGGFAIKLTEKIEDLISVLFLPLYFALSGLKTNLGLLNDGITWGYCIGVIACAFAGKIIGGTLAARANKLLWRESFTIGALMSCKGLVELIVLAGILSETTFSMFVVMALVTTVATTPMTKLLYPKWYQTKVERWRKGEIDWDGNELNPSESLQGGLKKGVDSQIRRLMVHLRLDSLPSLFTFITILSPESVTKKQVEPETPDAESTEVIIKKRPLEVHGMRILELTDRTSSVMHLTEGEDFYSLRDPVVNAFRTFSQLHDVAVSGRVAVVPADSYAETLMTQAHEVSSDFALIPWGESGSMSEDQSFPVTADTNERFKSFTHLDFISQTLEKASAICNAGIFIDNGFGGITKPVDRPELQRTKSAISIRNQADVAVLPVANKSHHVFFPFFGGADDRVALRIVLQLAKNPHVSATIVRINSSEKEKLSSTAKSAAASTTTTEDNSETNKTAVSSSPVSGTDVEDGALYATLKSSLPEDLATRVNFSEADVPAGKEELKEIILLAQQAVGNTRDNAGDVVVLGRRNAKKGFAEVGGSSSSAAGGGVPDLKTTVGEVAERLITTGIRASLLVIQAGGRGQA